MTEFLSGVVFALCCVAGLFFLRFWRKTRDRFFAFFAASFWLMALQRVMMLGLLHNEYLVGAYLIRLLAFVLIIMAIVDKNRVRGGTREGSRPS
ncbi:DUF5985 family protein [Archangium gephyra]|uniref:DUF5985 family protein n=1 Tax=Archangium gephyra TaxID=48 RepID=UPI0035D4EEF8